MKIIIIMIIFASCAAPNITQKKLKRISKFSYRNEFRVFTVIPDPNDMSKQIYFMFQYNHNEYTGDPVAGFFWLTDEKGKYKVNEVLKLR